MGINKVDSQLQSGIERIHDSIDKILVKMFKNLDHDLQDGVTGRNDETFKNR